MFEENDYQELYNLMSRCLVDLMEIVKKHEDENNHVHGHYKHPQLKYYKSNGMPHIIECDFFDGPKDYGSLFEIKEEKDKYSLSTIESYNDLIKYLEMKKGTFAEYVFFSEMNADFSRYKLFISYQIIQLLEQYIYLYSKEEINDDKLRNLVYDLFMQWFCEKLFVSICVPLLMVSFEKNELEIDEDNRVRKMTEQEMLSCFYIGGYGSYSELQVVEEANYILEFRNYLVNNLPLSTFDYHLDIDAFPIERINKWFVALRIITDIESGYARVFAKTTDWGLGKCNLVSVSGARAWGFNYKYVSDKLWDKPIPVVSKDQFERVKKLFIFFDNNKQNSLNVALQRMNNAYLRSSDQDAIIDTVIALEALVNSDGSGEITYKVSIRTACILSEVSECTYSAEEIYETVKKIYNYRSKIVHGKSTKANVNEIKTKDICVNNALASSLEILKYLILAIYENPRLLKSDYIDQYILRKYGEVVKC